jgi:transposase
MPHSRKTPYRERIPVKLMKSEFNEFALKHLPKKSYGPSYKIPLFKIFNYILYVLYTGCQWKMIPIEKDKTGKPEIHYTVFLGFFKKRWRLFRLQRS